MIGDAWRWLERRERRRLRSCSPTMSARKASSAWLPGRVRCGDQAGHRMVPGGQAAGVWVGVGQCRATASGRA